MKKVLKVLGLLVAAVALYALAIAANLFGDHRGPGIIEGAGLSPDDVSPRRIAQEAARGPLGVNDPAGKQILFGDLHVHTTFSGDAYMMSLPIMGGEGAHPVADACDYARYCSQLDFWSINDHAEALTPRKWEETKESLRDCQARAGDPANPDMVSLLGFEWSQVGARPEEHFGHKNVVFRGLDDDAIAPRPIGAAGLATLNLREKQRPLRPGVAIMDPANRAIYFDNRIFMEEITETPVCDAETPTTELPTDCYESAATPGDLADRLDAHGVDYLLIPHGSSWGIYTPPGVTWDKQLTAGMRPERQELIEVMSGHGNSEEYRSYRGGYMDAEGVPRCAEPTEDHTPSCWRAGEIIAARCLEAGETAETCEARAVKARQDYISIGVAGRLSVPGATVEDWLDAGQCRDCFLPPFNHRPGASVQYGLAISNLEGETPVRFDWGFIASSDNHRARPGTGYKPVNRKLTTESFGAISPWWRMLIGVGRDTDRPPASATLDPQALLDEANYIVQLEWDRQASFWTTGGLAAVHAQGRSRQALWDGLKRHETYGTSGPRILLWFDLVGVDGSRVPMGGGARLGDAPTFEVRAVGAFVQAPGCPDHAQAGLPPERLERLCRGECYHPGDTRHAITRVEVVRIRPQVVKGEIVDRLVEDPWRTLDCEGGAAGCVVRFTDPGYAAAGRDTLYYVRAIQAPTDTINGGQLRCVRDEAGRCAGVDPCYGDYRTPSDDDCLTPVEHRAWSSPVYLRYVDAG